VLGPKIRSFSSIAPVGSGNCRQPPSFQSAENYKLLLQPLTVLRLLDFGSGGDWR
jgi:hypothetical protein